MADLEVSVDGGALWLRLNRPEVLNALSDEMAADLARLVEEATARDDVRVVVLTGTGGAFCTGADLSGADAHERFDVRALDAANRIVRAITNLDKPENAFDRDQFRSAGAERETVDSAAHRYDAAAFRQSFGARLTKWIDLALTDRAVA